MESRSQRAEAESAAFAQECHDADVDYYPFLYGNNFALWSPALYQAVLKTYPSVRGSANTDSWEKATLCPSDPNTWKVIDAYVKEFVQKSHGDGLYATFWDHYGIFCQDDRCKADGMDQFSNELYQCIKQYHDTLAPLGKKLIVRTWASGTSHWLQGQWVHAPGYGGLSGEGIDIWGRVINELPADITLQTKVYAHLIASPPRRSRRCSAMKNPTPRSPNTRSPARPPAASTSPPPPSITPIGPSKRASACSGMMAA